MIILVRYGVAPFFPAYPLPRQCIEGVVYTDGKMLPRVRGVDPPSFALLCGPVQNDGHGLGLRLLELRVDQKALTIPAHVINKEVIPWDWLPGSGLEKHDWRPRIKSSSGRDRHANHLFV